MTSNFKLKPDSSVKQMVNFVRHEVGVETQDVSICVTGANFLLSDTGGVVLTENEGNILKSTSLAKIHIVVAGIAKVIPNMDDLSVLLPLLSLHSNGQSMAACNSITFGPSTTGNGPEQMYVILLDNNRSQLLAHETQRKVMSCIHCGACISICDGSSDGGFGGLQLSQFRLFLVWQVCRYLSREDSVGRLDYRKPSFGHHGKDG